MLNINRVIFILIGLVVLTLGGFSQADLISNNSAAQIRQYTRARYDHFYPYYIEGCSMTQLQKLDGYNGGIVGHAVAYVKGLCRDTSVGYPRVKICEPGHYTDSEEAAGIGFNDIHNVNAGLGFSANKQFSNVNWVAIPGHDLFFQGNQPVSSTVTDQTLDDVRDQLLKIGAYKGIKFSSKPGNPDIKDQTHYESNIITSSISTDVAFGLARSYHCVRIPIKKEMLPSVVGYLNNLNDHYVKTLDYNWNVINDNCTHLVDNILASVGFWRARDTSPGKTGYLKKLENFTNLAAPAISMYQIAKDANFLDFNNLPHIFWPGKAKDALLNHHWYAAQHGSLIDIVVARPQERNKVFKFVPPEQIGLIVNEKNAVKLARDPELIDIRANLEFFKRRYETYERPSSADTADFFIHKFYDSTTGIDIIFNAMKTYVQMQLVDVNEKLNDLNAHFSNR